MKVAVSVLSCLVSIVISAPFLSFGGGDFGGGGLDIASSGIGLASDIVGAAGGEGAGIAQSGLGLANSIVGGVQNPSSLGNIAGAAQGLASSIQSTAAAGGGGGRGGGGGADSSAGPSPDTGAVQPATSGDQPNQAATDAVTPATPGAPVQPRQNQPSGTLPQNPSGAPESRRERRRRERRRRRDDSGPARNGGPRPTNTTNLDGRDRTQGRDPHAGHRH
ncbi:hypothetical protein MP638_000507 [Amoeboaphelidium occidentale]|nr:hypothetical protein MP638_000507 [Amoeboaphelidium occidentale]